MTRLVLAGPVLRNGAQIHSAVVEPVMVDVVALDPISWGQAKEMTVKKNRDWLAVNGGLAICVPAVVDRPSSIVRQVGISSINECVGSNAAVTGAERDTHGAIIEAHSDSPPSVKPPAVASSAGVFALQFYHV